MNREVARHLAEAALAQAEAARQLAAAALALVEEMEPAEPVATGGGCTHPQEHRIDASTSGHYGAWICGSCGHKYDPAGGGEDK